MVKTLDAALAHWADHIESSMGIGFRDRKGAGAAGGLGFAMMALGARISPGAETILHLAGYDALLKQADAMITTEGRFDDQSFAGKAPWTAAVQARRHGVTTWILCGQCDQDSIDKARKVENVNVVEIGAELPISEKKARCAELLSRCVAGLIREN
jgi:glycerate kinase